MSYYREQYELSRELARERLETCEALGKIINEQQDLILALKKENGRLKREYWNLKRTKRRKK
ncbi:hypothetical protein K6V42_06975 [Streptococcus suis]|uniref:hypothetical protein n=1 Tax=Streptococcus suis TaxID=1307 RepID=UPI001C97E5BC|nr:hypothetical protein [Streptococcus suis]MBY4981967.1 hypothetical protein [Streptococcus suis]MBY4992713.1 hypothetical protein [Streptococcus suis]MBY5008120.1 hypothetical protein [Streptococcus suis]